MQSSATTIATHEATELESVAKLLGGRRILGRPVRDWFAAHDLLAAGLPSGAVTSLAAALRVLDRTDLLEKGLGISVRSYQRWRDEPTKRLSPEHSGRTWQFAEILAKATEVLGSQEEAEQWLQRPAIALNQRRPIDLLATPAGVDLVETLLMRLEYGVYT